MAMKSMKSMLVMGLALAAPTLTIARQEQPPPPPPAQESPAPIPEPALDARAWYRLGVAAYQRKDYLGFLENMKKALELEPDSPLLIYNMAAASALVGNKEDALSHLSRLASMRVFMDAAGDSDFDSMKETPEFKAIVERLRALKTRVGASTTAFTLPEKDLITEGVALDPVSGDFFVSSVHQRRIVRVSRKGKPKDFIASKQDGLWAVLGMKVDAERRTLWACSSSVPQMIEGTPEEPARGTLFRFDMDTGALKGKYALGGGAEGHDCNDLTVGSRGDVFVSDNRAGEIATLPAGSQELAVLIPAGTLRSPQGLAFTPDEKTLYVAEYGRGLSRIDLAAKTATPLSHPADLPLQGIDGLLWWKGGLIAIQNGITPHRVVRLDLSAAGDAVTGSRILEMSNPSFDEPTLGVVAGKTLYYVANSQWSRFDKNGAIFPMNRLAEPVILKLELE